MLAGRLGEYVVKRDIAEGAFGKVKLATHTLTGTDVALKCIRKATVNAQNPKARTRVAREIEYLKLVNHPHVIKLYEVINTPTDVILVTEYAGGELFRFIVENRSISEEQARRFFQQIMTAIAYLHSLGIVHRDIKPENVLLDEDTLNVKLADLGLSNEITDGDFLRTWCGSANYAAPEVISNQPYPGPEIDVWSAGVMLYLLMCGRLPFEDDHAPTLYQKIQYGVYELPNWLSPDTRYLISRMLVVDPVKRITVPDILAHPWTYRGLPKYLTRAVTGVPTAPLFLGTLSTLVQSEEILVAKGFGKLDQGIIQQLAKSIGVETHDIIHAMQEEGENAVKVAYTISQDRRRLTPRDLNTVLEESEGREKAVDPTWLASTAAPPTEVPRLRAVPVSDRGVPLDDSDEEAEGDIDWSEENNFAVLNSSLVGATPSEESMKIVMTPFGLRPHQLHTYERSRSKRAGKTASSSSRRGQAAGMLPKPIVTAAVVNTTTTPIALSRPPLTQTVSTSINKVRPPKWNWGIRSSNPPMEVMLEVYKSLKLLGAEWREKRHPWSFQKFPYPPQEFDDITTNSDIFFVETRWRLRGHFVRIDIQLYQVHASNYLLDFRNVGHTPIPPAPSTYAGSDAGSNSYPSTPQSLSSPPSTTRFESLPKGGGSGSLGGSAARAGPGDGRQYTVTNPFLFLECATRLIADLAAET